MACLPHSLPALLQQKAWRSAVEPVARRLIRLLPPSGEGPQANSGVQLSTKDRATDKGVHVHDVAQIAAACLVAIRQQLADDAWQHMPQILTCLSQQN